MRAHVLRCPMKDNGNASLQRPHRRTQTSDNGVRFQACLSAHHRTRRCGPGEYLASLPTDLRQSTVERIAKPCHVSCVSRCSSTHFVRPVPSARDLDAQPDTSKSGSSVRSHRYWCNTHLGVGVRHIKRAEQLYSSRKPTSQRASQLCHAVIEFRKTCARQRSIRCLSMCVTFVPQ